MRLTGRQLFAGLVAAVVTGACIAGLLLVDPPGVERQRGLDRRRVADLEHIAGAVDGYWRRHGALPPDLATLGQAPTASIHLTDPASGEPYGYRETGADSYELCAVFETEATHHMVGRLHPAPWRREPFVHGPGHHCLEFYVGRRNLSRAVRPPAA